MQVYSQADELIERWQWNDPALRNLSDVVLNLLEGKQGRVLDPGCGSGRLANAGFSVDGSDTDERVIAIGQRIMAEQGLDVQLYSGDVFNLQHPFRCSTPMLVTCAVSQTRSYLANCARRRWITEDC